MNNTDLYPIVFRRKRAWKELVGSFLITVCAAGMLAFIAYVVAMGVVMWLIGPIGLLLVIETVTLLVVIAIIVPVMLLGLSLFGCFFIDILKEFFLLNSVLELLPSGISGRTNVYGVNLIPWECIASVKLETQDERTVIGIQTTVWPPVPIWKKCSSDARRMLWKRHNRRQTPFYLYIDDAAAPPEAIVHTIQEELIRARERELTPHPPKEGGTPL